MVKEGFYLAIVVLIVAVIAAILGQVAPILERTSQSIVNIQAAPQLAQITVTAAQYALDQQKAKDAIDARKAAQDIQNSGVLTGAKADLDRARGEAAILAAKNNWIPYAILGLAATVVISIIGTSNFYRIRATKEIQLAPFKNEQLVAGAVAQNGGMASFRPSGEREYKPLAPAQLPASAVLPSLPLTNHVAANSATVDAPTAPATRDPR